MDAQRVVQLVDVLQAAHIVFACGVDIRRYVLMEHAKCWMMTTTSYGYFIRPWCTSSGDVNAAVFR